MANYLYYKMNDLFDRHKLNRHKTLTDDLLHVINKEMLLVDKQYSALEVSVLQQVKK